MSMSIYSMKKSENIDDWAYRTAIIIGGVIGILCLMNIALMTAVCVLIYR